jgi:Glycosyltransferases, probably involved in cell wall biogenesis
LDAVLASSYKSYEIIVVDDASTDDSPEICREKGAIVFRLPHQSGPGAARNYGAEKAQGDILFFVDSDVVIRRDTVARVAEDFMKNPDIAAVFGSYDDSPTVPDFLSQFRNLLHHFTHQNSREEAVTFWAGCGAIRRDIFHEVGGFDQDKYPKPSIEDIELGYRLRKAGYRIMLDKGLQAKHLKNWEWRSMLKNRIFNRAVPWSQLILESRSLPSDLNLQTSHRLVLRWSVCLVFMLPLIFLIPLIFSSIAVGGVLFTVFLF